jgi:hypothetical protein
MCILLATNDPLKLDHTLMVVDIGVPLDTTAKAYAGMQDDSTTHQQYRHSTKQKDSAVHSTHRACDPGPGITLRNRNSVRVPQARNVFTFSGRQSSHSIGQRADPTHSSSMA